MGQDRLMKRMSISNPCKLIDNLWDEFAQNDVLVMPYRGGEVNESVDVSGAYQKSRHVGSNVGKSTGSRGLTRTVLWKKEKPYLFPPMNYGNPDPECIPNAIMRVSQDAEVSDSCITDCTINPDSNIFCTGNSIVGTGGSTDRSNDCCFLFDDASPAVKDTDLLENGHEDRENDLAYYDWPDIANFEDIDKMFSDSTSGQGCTDNANELSWFPSLSHSIYGSEVTSDPGLQSSCSELSMLNNALEHQSANINFSPKIDSPSAINDNSSTVGYQLNVDLLDAGAGNNDKFASKKFYDQRDEMKLSALNQTCSGNGFSGSEDLDMITAIESQHSSEKKIIQQLADQKHPSSAVSASEAYQSENMLEQKHFLGSASSSYMHTFNPYSDLEPSFPAHQVTCTQTTLSKAFKNVTELSSSHRVLDHVTTDSYQRIKRLPNESSLPPTMTSEGKMEKHRQQLHGTMTVDHRQQHASCTSKTMVLKNQHKSQHEIGCSSEQGEGSIELSAIGMDSSLVHENSFMTTISSDGISLEPTSFQQLQDVIDQLDVRTKLCMRDSLYRLARSARQRHNFSNTSNCSRESRDARGIQSTETSDMCEELTNAETGTNPIDRSVAHLLYHKPSGPSTGPADDAISFESRIIVSW
ncbi:protein LNK1-like [Phoenix dactylifera]|uniref:Protein LNK1-like n=1 Tax=Phoenix dactylifera TaxID=42345 RepID=A0A8B9AJN9_PHODC|nr:protein LNK1-like [Phoenix dactylifera]